MAYSYLRPLVNRGDGTFPRIATFEVIGGRGFTAAADLDLDGDLDAATANSVLINKGNGEFHWPLAYPQLPEIEAVSDLDGDGWPDLVPFVDLYFNATAPPSSRDLNQNGLPDGCDQGAFHRGDPNGDGRINITDAIALWGFLFLSGEAPACLESADANNDGTVNISDGLHVLRWLFLSGSEPAAPGPRPGPCGFDPDPPGSPGDLGCASYDRCVDFAAGR